MIFRYLQRWREDEGIYRYQDSANKIGITLPGSKGWWRTTSLTVYSSNGKGAMGIVGVPWLVADEPGAWEVNKGQVMADAIFGALGKPGSDLKCLFIGTLAPAMGGWWHNLIKDGTDEASRTYVKALQGNVDSWDKWPTIQKANPLTRVSPEFRQQLLVERNKARKDSALKARFLSYRLNLPSGDESEILIDVTDWRLALARPVAPREGIPIVGVDLGAGRSWSAAVAIWPNGRTEAMAVAPGIPSLEDQEKRDRVPRGTYTKLAAAGYLHVAEGKRVQPVHIVTEWIETRWPEAEDLICDRFRSAELQDHSRMTVRERVTRWSEASEDIRAFRSWAKDGPMSVEKNSRMLITSSLAVTAVKNDDQGGTRLMKRGFNSEGRDDVAAALVLASGHAERERRLAAAPILVG